jgi:hypothetical protein
MQLQKIQTPLESNIVSDGKKLAKAQLLATLTAKRLSSGRFWSAQDVRKILQEGLSQIDKIIENEV